MNSKILLCKNIKMDRNYVNVLDYSESEMLTLCNSQEHLIASRNNYSFLRPTNSIYVDFTYSQCIQANYIAFQNTDYSNKWFFAWIDEVIYKSDKNCELKYTIDSWSTWFDYWTKQTCFINRQHVNNDAIGANIVEENLNVGDVVQETYYEDISFSEYLWIGVLTSHNPSTNSDFPSPITVYNGNVMAKKLCLFKATDMTNLVNLGLFLLATNANSHSEDIDSVFFIPDALIIEGQLTLNTGEVGGQNYSFYTCSNDFNITEFNMEIDKITSFSDYTPKNNKCFCYPTNYLLVTNNIGNNNIYRYEDFSTSNVVFKMQATMSVGISGRTVPQNYKGIVSNDDESIPLAKYPTIEWSSDSYINWLTQQAVNIPTQLTSSIVNSGINLSTGNILGSATTIASSISSQIGSFYQASLLPNVTHGQNTADITFLAKRNTFTYRCMRAKTQFLKIIDDYYTRFGYAIKSLETPNITGRKYWNYVEIGSSECIGYGEVPSTFMNDINNACRKGVTIWHDHSNIGNYSLNNVII